MYIVQMYCQYKIIEYRIYEHLRLFARWPDSRYISFFARWLFRLKVTTMRNRSHSWSRGDDDDDHHDDHNHGDHDDDDHNHDDQDYDDDDKRQKKQPHYSKTASTSKNQFQGFNHKACPSLVPNCC